MSLPGSTSSVFFFPLFTADPAKSKRISFSIFAASLKLCLPDSPPCRNRKSRGPGISLRGHSQPHPSLTTPTSQSRKRRLIVFLRVFFSGFAVQRKDHITTWVTRAPLEMPSTPNESFVKYVRLGIEMQKNTNRLIKYQ